MLNLPQTAYYGRHSAGTKRSVPEFVRHVQLMAEVVPADWAGVKVSTGAVEAPVFRVVVVIVPPFAMVIDAT